MERHLHKAGGVLAVVRWELHANQGFAPPSNWIIAPVVKLAASLAK